MNSSLPKRDALTANLPDPAATSSKRLHRSSTALSNQMAQSSLQRQLLSLQTSKSELEAKLREKEMNVERLERDRRWLAEREREEREEKERDRTEWEEEKRKKDVELRSMRSNLATLTETHEDLVDSHQSLTRTSSQTIASLKSQISTLQNENSLLNSELSETRALAAERSATIHSLQDELDLAPSRRESTGNEDWTVLREELSRQAIHLHQLESSNARMTSELTMLRSRKASFEVLAEEKRGLERKIRSLESLREKVVSLEGQLDAAREERKEWARTSKSTETAGMAQSLSALRLEHAKLLEQQGSSSALLATRASEIQGLEQTLENTRLVVDDLKREIQELQESVRRAETGKSLAEMEVNFSKALLASYTAEETQNSAATTVVADDVSTKRIEQMETLLIEYKTKLDAATNELKTVGGSVGSGKSKSRATLIKEMASLESALESANEEIQTHISKIDALEQSLFELTGTIAAGEHVPPKTRVLSLRDNPAQNWTDLRQQVMDRLKEENEALLRRLADVQSQGPSDGGESLVPRESLDAAIEEAKELREVVKQKELRLKRLQSVFNSKSAEFKEAISNLLGIKFAFYPNGNIRLTSMYDLNASFIFHPSRTSSDGGQSTFELVAQGEEVVGQEEIKQLMRNWVEVEQCIPCFMASLTLDCWERQRNMES